MKQCILNPQSMKFSSLLKENWILTLYFNEPINYTCMCNLLVLSSLHVASCSLPAAIKVPRTKFVVKTFTRSR